MEYIQTVGVLIYQGKEEVLLVKHGPKAGHITDSYGLPAGRIEEGETSEEAAIRELREETGLKTKKEYLFKTSKTYYADIKRKDGKIKKYSMEVYICKKYSGILNGNDETVPEWINVGDLEKISLIGSAKEVIFDGLKELEH